mmetsp:Transcript_49134/g.158114  ORF Transcript_49134/g.158114 Transcript_49134/m.158114 type:complete len:259 (+) Transcript_49134:538-1314(+)
MLERGRDAVERWPRESCGRCLPAIYCAARRHSSPPQMWAVAAAATRSSSDARPHTALTSVRETSTLILSTSTLRTPRVRVGCGAATRRRSAGWAPSWWGTLWCMRLCASCCCRLPSAALTRPRTSLRAASAEARQRPSPRRSTLSRSACRPRSTRRRPTPTRRCRQCGERLSLRRAGASSSEVLSRGSRPTRRRAPSCLPCTRRGTGGSRRGWGREKRAVESSRRGAAGYEGRRVCECLRAAGLATAWCVSQRAACDR